MMVYFLILNNLKGNFLDYKIKWMNDLAYILKAEFYYRKSFL
jgi:hypothetical protein